MGCPSTKAGFQTQTPHTKFRPRFGSPGGTGAEASAVSVKTSRRQDSRTVRIGRVEKERWLGHCLWPLTNTNAAVAESDGSSSQQPPFGSACSCHGSLLGLGPRPGIKLPIFTPRRYSSLSSSTLNLPARKWPILRDCQLSQICPVIRLRFALLGPAYSPFTPREIATPARLQASPQMHSHTISMAARQ